MARSGPEVADIFRRYGAAYRESHGASLCIAQRRVMSAIELCRTAALGGHVERCDHCDHKRICYNSCRDRHCPKCQSLARAQWLDDRRSELLDTQYFHVVFTIPPSIAAIALQNKEIVYGILFRAASETLRTIAAAPKHLGAQIGFFAVLHTWGQALFHHPHLHCVVPGGGISPDGTRWISCRRKFLLPVLVLARLFRRLFLDYLRKAFDAGDLQFFSSLESLRTRDAFLRHIAPIQKKDSVVYAKRPFAGPEQVLKYFARYTHRIAISNNRLLDIDDGKVQFRWKDYRNGHRQKTMTLGADEFIRRFLLHVLPNGFQRIRYFGFLANRYRAEKLALCRQLMQMSPPTATRKVSMDYRDRYEVLTGVFLKTCPLCRGGTMVVIETFECAANRAPIMDTS
ncbi:IS91 family transposase [Bradyrhizobium sp. WSM2254]|uniref:IS91 family transposase n=1 Tax=Bradyrhizobium sp. WSM2254 TaxID=1188263 RepID=UPI000405EDB9|nr:IS91 family transposase [Bradyrhizobium sp. WSM2254]